MSPFAMTLREVGQVEVASFKNIPIENQHNIQTHVVDLNILVSSAILFVKRDIF